MQTSKMCYPTRQIVVNFAPVLWSKKKTRDIFARFGGYLYSTKCKWIINLTLRYASHFQISPQPVFGYGTTMTDYNRPFLDWSVISGEQNMNYFYGSFFNLQTCKPIGAILQSHLMQA